MLAPRFDALVGSMCVSKSSGPVLISGDGTIASCSICLSTPSCCCSGKSGVTSHSSGSSGDTVTIALEHGLSGGCTYLVPLVGLLVPLFHVFLIVRFSESDPNVV